MRQSQLFTKTRKEAPRDEVSKNAKLLIRAGFLHKEMAGVYTYLPLGLRVLKKVEQIIREEMNLIGGQEMLLTTLQDPNLWEKSGRWDDGVVDNWFKTKLVNGGELGVANTHEEPLTAIILQHTNSYKDFPIYAYQFQTKFRNELRAKSGIMRGREFLMKDLYSFSRSEEEFKKFYELCADSYLKIFRRVGIGDITYRTLASGGSFTDGFTDEFQAISEAGEDTIYVDKEKGIAINKEVYKEENIERLGLNKDNLKEEKSIEVGNIFPLGTRYSESLGLYYIDEKGESRPVIMGSYGIGLGRLIGTIVEVLSDDSGIVWPESVSPFKIHLVEISGEDSKVKSYADKLYDRLEKAGVETLYDDRTGIRAGEKFADSDLIGISKRVVVSRKTLEAGVVEIVDRKTGKVELVSESELFV
jgi:prolyl-tRNA synthetase